MLGPRRGAYSRGHSPPRPKRSLGQNFLLDSSLARGVVQVSGVTPGNRVLEVGPGRGALTTHLLEMGALVLAVEKDDIYAAELGATAPPALRVVHEDVLAWKPLVSGDAAALLAEFPCAFNDACARADDASLLESSCIDAQSHNERDERELGDEEDSRASVLGNIPYNITTPLLEVLLPRSDAFREVVLMLQREAAMRLVSLEPGGKDYRAFSTFVDYHCEKAEIIAEVGREAFTPKPRVDSCVVRFTLRAHDERRFAHLGRKLERKFHRFVSLAFTNRRKMVRNNLASSYGGANAVVDAMCRAGIDSDARPQNLDVDAFASIYEALVSSAANQSENVPSS